MIGKYSQTICGVIITCLFLSSILLINAGSEAMNDNNSSVMSSRQSTNLTFQISMTKTIYKVGEPINVTCTLTNTGNTSINVSKINFYWGTIDFNISTPNGYNIHYTGDYYDSPCPSDVLKPHTSINYTSDLTDPTLAFGTGSPNGRFDFTPTGNYKIQTIYTSNPALGEDQTVWGGEFTSNMLNFQITNSSKILINELYINTIDKFQWVELYNPTSSSVDINGWIINYWTVFTITKISQQAVIGSNQFILICNNLTKLTAMWDVPEAIQIISVNLAFYAVNETSISDNSGIIDYLNYGGPPSGAPKVPVNHSVARYKGGYDTDNSSHDFYNESTPTPGQENTESKNEEPEVILEFFSSLNKQKYIVGEPVYITSTLTNIGNTSVFMSRFSLELNRIDFYISTPEGYNISFKPSVFGGEIIVKLDPGTSMNYTVDITDPVWNFGNLDGIDHYNFTTLGNYAIRSVYTSALFSTLLDFEIIDNTSNNGGGGGGGSTNDNGENGSNGWVTITTTYAPGLAIAAICIIISISLVAGTEIGKYGFFAAVSPLYTRLDRDAVVQTISRD